MSLWLESAGKGPLAYSKRLYRFYRIVSGRSRARTLVASRPFASSSLAFGSPENTTASFRFIAPPKVEG